MITFTLTFHGPFHVGTGNPEAGMDRPVDRGALLPATSLKGRRSSSTSTPRSPSS